MIRIKFANDGAGSGAYEIPYNPVEIYCPQSQLEGNSNSVETIDGETITFYAYHDSRRGKLVWKGFPKDSSGIGTAFFTMIDTNLSSYVGGYKYMNFGDIADAFGVYETWTKVKIIAVNRSLRSGGGVIYDPVELIWENAEA